MSGSNTSPPKSPEQIQEDNINLKNRIKYLEEKIHDMESLRRQESDPVDIALRTVPEFDGKNILPFLRAVNRISLRCTQVEQTQVLRNLRHKIATPTYSMLKYLEFSTIGELIDNYKRIFHISQYQYDRRLTTILMRDNANLLEFIEQYMELCTEMKDLMCLDRNVEELPPEENEQLEKAWKTNFIDALAPNIQDHLINAVADCTLTELIVKAIETERVIKDRIRRQTER